MKRKADRTKFADLPTDPAERHEEVMDFVGQDIMGLRNEALEVVFSQLEREDWDNLLPYDAKFFEKASGSLDPEQREVAQKLCERVMTHFMDRFMTMIWCDGRNNPIGMDHGLQYRFKAEIRYYPKESQLERYKDTDQETLEPGEIDDFEPIDETPTEKDDSASLCEEHELTKGGQLSFPQYWHRWMNRFGSP